MKRILSAVALAILSTTAAAQTFTGNDAWNLMKGPQQDTLMLGYVSGMMDAYRAEGVFGTAPTVCPPASVTNGQAYDMLQRYMRDNPEVRHVDIGAIASAFYLVKWPCAKKATKGKYTPM